MYIGVPHFCSTFLACLNQRYLSSKIKQLFAVLDGIEEQPVIKKIILLIYFLKASYLLIRFLIKITTITPHKFPNKSDH